MSRPGRAITAHVLAGAAVLGTEAVRWAFYEAAGFVVPLSTCCVAVTAAAGYGGWARASSRRPSWAS